MLYSGLCNVDREMYINDVFQHLFSDIIPGLGSWSSEPIIFNGARAAALICLCCGTGVGAMKKTISSSSEW